MTAQVERTAGDAGAAGAAGAADTAGTGRASRAPGTVRRRVLVGAAALLMLTGGATIAHGAADGADGTPAPHGGGHAAHSTGTGAATGTGTGTTDASDSGKAGGTGRRRSSVVRRGAAGSGCGPTGCSPRPAPSSRPTR